KHAYRADAFWWGSASRAEITFRSGSSRSPSLGRREARTGRFLARRSWVWSSNSVATIKIFRSDELLGRLVGLLPLQAPYELFRVMVSLRWAAAPYPVAQRGSPFPSSFFFVTGSSLCVVVSVSPSLASIAIDLSK